MSHVTSPVPDRDRRFLHSHNPILEPAHFVLEHSKLVLAPVAAVYDRRNRFLERVSRFLERVSGSFARHTSLVTHHFPKIDAVNFIENTCRRVIERATRPSSRQIP